MKCYAGLRLTTPVGEGSQRNQLPRAIEGAKFNDGIAQSDTNQSLAA